MNRKWLLLPLAIAVAVPLVWFASNPEQRADVTAALGLKPAPVAAVQRHKPVCSEAVNPNVAAPTDCIPQYIAKLPPDPGAAGKATIEGIDSDNDGVRDDVQRFIAERWGYSERAVKALTLLSKDMLMQVRLGDSVTRDEAYEIAKKMSMTVHCYSNSVDSAIRVEGQALVQVQGAVTNTPEREKRFLKFDLLTAQRVYVLPDDPIPEACGYDPAKLAS